MSHCRTVPSPPAVSSWLPPSRSFIARRSLTCAVFSNDALFSSHAQSLPSGPPVSTAGSNGRKQAWKMSCCSQSPKVQPLEVSARCIGS